MDEYHDKIKPQGQSRGAAVAAGKAASFLAAALLASASASAGPFQLGTALGTPNWLTLGGSYRVRYETLEGAFRKGQVGSDQMLDERLLLHVEAELGALYVGGELEDARAQRDDTGTHLGTDSVDAFEPLRMYLGYRATGAFEPGDKLNVQVGRITIDEGSRRLVARNSFRNTINAFTGVRSTWTGPGATTVDAFFVLPVNRMPSTQGALLDNDVQLDSETTHTRFWGLFVSRPNLVGRATGELYMYGLHDESRPGVAVPYRDLYTPGFRLVTKPVAGDWDYELESALQFGTSRLSATSTRNFRHLAGFLHASFGYAWAASWSPHLSFDYDYASGDRNPNDGQDNRFDTLYGARRFDFGPTGIYGAVARGNIDTPGLRLGLKPDGRLEVMAAYRLLWLASSRDAWTSANLQDPTGAAGRFLGDQAEAELRYAVVPGNLALEFGGAVLTHGSFQRQVPEAPKVADTTYGYAAVTAAF